MSIHNYIFILLTFSLLFYFKKCTSQTFDQLYTGVILRPYVKQPINGSTNVPARSDYTKKEIRVMLEIILEKFSRVATIEAGFKSVSYTHNVTNHEDSTADVYVAEIAAEINLQRGKKVLNILQGLSLHGNQQVETELQLAVECAEKANKIYPGTVEGIWFSPHFIYLEKAEKTKKYLDILRSSSVRDLKFGAWMDCNKLFSDNKSNSTTRKKQAEVLFNILNNSDFVICNMINKKGACSFHSIITDLIDLRTKLQNQNANLEIMGLLKWSTTCYQNLKNIKSHNSHWEAVSRWAKENSFPLWFHEAFDNPAKSNDGWWRLSDNTKSEQKDGYIENFSEPPKITTVDTVLIVSIVVALSVILFLMAVIAFLVFRGKKQQIISIQDIREFREGISDETFPKQEDHNIEIPGYKLPFDNSMELDKNQLKIDTKRILGKGHFGRVYLAVIKLHGNVDENVALKVSKNNCSRSTLKDLLSEIKVMYYVGNHPNIVTLRGVCTAELQTGTVYIATELCSLGSLESYLRQQENHTILNRTYENVPKEENSVNTCYDNTSESICLLQMLTWSHEIACGMEYLGTKNVVHADLATRNVLLTKEKIAKISDFGLSRRMYNYSTYVKSNKVPLPWRWMAIESLKWAEFSSKSDVWSYGITVWEMFSFGEIPYSGLVWTPKFVKMLVEGMRLENPNCSTPEMYEIYNNKIINSH